MHRQLRVSAAVIGVLVTPLLVASCGGSTASSSSTTTSTASSGSTGASSSTPIVVGGDGDLALEPGMGQGFQAGIYRFNKAGGLDGRMIQFTGFLDDGLSAQTNLTNAQQLVQNKHAMAVVPFQSAVATAATGTFLAQSQVPAIGWGTNVIFNTQSDWAFGINGNQINNVVQGLAGGAQILTATGNTKTPSKVKVASIAENIAPGISANDAVSGALKAAGMQIVYKEAPIAVLGTTNFAPYAQAIIASGANLAFETLDIPDAVGLSAALKSAGFKGTIVNGVTYLPGLLAAQPSEAAAINGVYVENEFPADENATPAVKQAQQDLVSVGQPPHLTSGVSIGYWSAIVFEQMLRATLAKVGGDPNKVTGATLQQTVNAGYTYTDPIAGGIGTETFPAAKTNPTGCGTLLKVVGTGYKQIVSYQCLGAVNVVTQKKLDPVTGKPLS
ncbi:MAG TPA: ABC transporter substrate-binding protein [Acidimicrobiales bacterium]|jgi:Periplasmic binding protein|nr:ABC transporter substrate-binding protein [Acidimicrobiales bacterium]